jgi:hypothetical protein
MFQQPVGDTAVRGNDEYSPIKSVTTPVSLDHVFQNIPEFAHRRSPDFFNRKHNYQQVLNMKGQKW